MLKRTTTSIKGLDKAEVLVALYNSAKRVGMGTLNARGASPLSLEEAKALCEECPHFDYLHGRPLKVALDTDTIDTTIYNYNHGKGAAEMAIFMLRCGV